MKSFKINTFVFYLIMILYMELLTKVVITKHFFNSGLLYLIIFTLPIVLLLTILTRLFKKGVNKFILIFSSLIITIYFAVQYIFYNLFSVPFSFSTIGLADQALDFTSIIKDAILAHWLVFGLILLPFILLIVFNKRVLVEKYKLSTITSLVIMCITSYLFTYLTLIPGAEENNSAKNLYYNIDDQISIIDKFGMLTYTKIDIKRQLFGYESQLLIEDDNDNDIEEEPGEKVYEKNELEIDFDSLDSSNKNIVSLNNYVSKQNATKKNEYTGIFKDKNVIFILAEGFNEIAVDEVRTPTLYKLVNNGFVFENFYSPVFLSTTGGEFQATTGLIPTQEILGAWKSKLPTIKYGLGHVFSSLDYRVQSYHNWTHTYYKRHKTMETLGFYNYTGCGNGLEAKMNCGWLPKDSEMIDVTTPDYLGKEGKFATYYVTVSGHSPYNYNDNIGRLHFDTVKDLEVSDSVKYYLASQVELDKMLEELIKKLEESGELKDTVIALVGDHYPYTLSIDEVNEAASYKKDSIIEVNRSNFILWNSEIEEPIKVEKVGSQIDVLPTLLNLFGVKYDSRMIIGKDILSDYEGLAIFSNRSWVSDYGYYNSGTRKFTLKEGKNLDDESVEDYVKRINNRVANSFSISKLLIDNDYYKYILGS